ncbi:hypothetical protein [Delftia acidovorans]|uniref:hypothetical protein n=1 Tax=Delftia acidovorans TaxID=80866 RepID=UPI0031194BDD
MTNTDVDLYTMGGVLGHKSAVSMKRYSHLATKTLKSAVALVGKKIRTTAKKKRLEHRSCYFLDSKEKGPVLLRGLVFFGGSCEIRTRDQRIESQIPDPYKSIAYTASWKYSQKLAQALKRPPIA